MEILFALQRNRLGKMQRTHDNGTITRWFQKGTLRFVSPALALAAVLAGCLGTGWAQKPLGTDVSGYQPGNVNWSAATNGGVRFAWTKATEGTGYINPNFQAQVAGAIAAKVPIGLYHYSRPGLHPNIHGASSADTEAAYFWSVAGPYIKYGGQYLMPMLDWEDVGTSGQPATAPNKANGFTTAQMSAWLNEWCTAVSNSAYASGVIINPVVYSGTWYCAPGSTWPGLDSSVTYHPNNMSGYPSNPNPQTGAPSTTPWSSFTFWQYADTNWTGGDSDVYNGTMASLLKNFVIGGTNAPAINTQPASLNLVLGGSGTMNVGATGLAPLHFQWQFNGTNIPGATSAAYHIGNAQFASAGAYQVIVSNSYALVPSSMAYVSITGPLTNDPDATVVAPGGVLDWWPADGNTKDIAGTLTSSPVGTFGYAPGKTGLAFNFDGSTAYLTTSGASLPVPWTACMWVKRASGAGTAAGLLEDGTYALKLEQYKATHKVGLTILGVGDYVFTPNYTAPVGTWVHLAFVGTSAGTSLYVNGAFQASLTNSIPLPRKYIGAAYISSSAKTVDFLSGSLDEVLIYNRALSPSEIASVYSAGGAGLVRAPVLVNSDFTGNGQFSLSLKGQSGKTLSVYSSTDLLNWTRLTTFSNPNGAIVYTDSRATNSAQFYRITQP
ncbi:MAG TPA: GH25 family lysozyme [Verrucomicrobiae bacterium]|nr:GH25 family lysozyme [Verrucomicrobiae bacterium]